jgi:hypothetical protein
MALHLYVNAETQCTKGIKHGNRGDAFLHLVYTPPPGPPGFRGNGMSSIGYLGRFFETARTAW